MTPGKIYNTKLRPMFILYISFAFFFTLAGCATPKVVFIKDNVSFNDYKVAYIISHDKGHDPRMIVPVVASKMRGLGFDVKEVKSGEPFEGTQGSGFVITPAGHILTAEHVLAKAKQATVWLGRNRIEAEVLCSDKDKDLALLKPTGPLPEPVKPLFINFDTPAKMGQEVYTIGFPLTGMLGHSPRLAKGLVSSTVGLNDNPDMLQVSVETQSGNSGGPLFDAEGNVLGVLLSTLNPMAVLQVTGGTLPQNVNFAAKSTQIKAFLDACSCPIFRTSKSARAHSFDTVKDSVVQVYSGLISADFIKRPKLVVGIRYLYLWDLFFRLPMFQIELYDFNTGNLLLRAGQYRDNPFASEGQVIDRTFEAIKAKIAAPPAALTEKKNGDKQIVVK